MPPPAAGPSATRSTTSSRTARPTHRPAHPHDIPPPARDRPVAGPPRPRRVRRRRLRGRLPGGTAAGDPWASWLNPTSALVGLLAVATCAYLAAVFLVADARRRGDADLAGYFRRRATAAAVAAGALALAGIVVLRMDAPVLADELGRRGWPLVAASVGLGTAALALLRRGVSRGTRVLAVCAVVAGGWGGGGAHRPDILPGSLSLAAAASPAGSLEALLVVFIVAALVIAPSLGLLYYLDQRSRLVGHGSGSNGT